MRELRFWDTFNGVMTYSRDYTNLTEYFFYRQAVINADNGIEDMLFVEHKDLNGRQIFEGDIVKAHYFYQGVGENFGVTEEDGEIIGEVFVDSLYGCGIRNKKQTLFFSETSDEEEPCIEIIGDKFSNPELMEGK